MVQKVIQCRSKNPVFLRLFASLLVSFLIFALLTLLDLLNRLKVSPNEPPPLWNSKRFVSGIQSKDVSLLSLPRQFGPSLFFDRSKKCDFVLHFSMLLYTILKIVRTNIKTRHISIRSFNFFKSVFDLNYR